MNTRYFARLDADHQVTQTTRVSAKRIAAQKSSVEITKAQHELISSSPDLTFTIAVDGSISSAPKVKEAWRSRKENYPDIGDQLDAIWKAIDAIATSAHIPLPKEARDALAAIDRVKKDFPQENKPDTDEGSIVRGLD